MTDHADTIRRYIADAMGCATRTEAHAALDALLAEKQQLGDTLWKQSHAAAGAVREVERLREALREIEALQPRVLRGFKRHGIVFDRAPAQNPDPGDWQQVAFSIYTSLCEADSIARDATGTDE